MEIVLVEDEPNLRAALAYAFEREGWTIRAFGDGEAAWAWFEAAGLGRGADAEPGARVVVADITMPRMDGLELCRRVRATDAALPWLFLSSRDEEYDRVLGLETGADDYLCKPFSVRELIARIKVLARRAGWTAGTAWLAGVGTPPAAVPGTAAASGDGGLAAAPSGAAGLSVDRDGYRAWWDGQELRLTVSEFRILACLAEQPGAARTREQLQLAAYPDDLYINERSVDCHIKRLRRKLAEAGAGDPIGTAYGLGYRWAP